jgi:hypothetical protein
MSAAACRAAMDAAPTPYLRASALDAAFPVCECEQWSLSETHANPIADDELIARILTSPDGYNETEHTIVTSKLSDIYSLGMSVIRQGASDAEILATIGELTSSAHDERNLVGAVLLETKEVRAYLDDERWFGVYATDDRGKSHHGDILGTFPDVSNNQKQKITGRRRYRLRDDIIGKIIFSEDPAELIEELRARGF